MKYRILIPIVLLATLVACSKAPDSTSEEVRPVRVQTVVSGDGAQSASYSGEIRARYESPIGFRMPGQVIARQVQLGQEVKAGQVLMKLDPRDFHLQETAARSQFEKARLDLERAQSLHERGFVSQSNVDEARTNFNTMQSQYRIAANQTGYSVLSAERNGVVIAINAEVGQVVGAGMAVMKIAEGDEREVVISVPESRVEELRSAKHLTVSLWASPGKIYKAHLREMSADTESATRTYSARIAIEKPDDQLRLGMTANVLLPGESSSAYVVPLTAIFDADGRSHVWMVDGKSMQVKAQQVTIVGTRKDAVVVTSGVMPGDVIVTAGVHLLHAGDKVRKAPDLTKVGASK